MLLCLGLGATAKMLAQAAQFAGQRTVVASGFENVGLVATDPAGNAYVTDYSAGTITEIPANGGPAAVVVSGLNHPTGVFPDGNGNLYVCLYLSGSVIRVAPDGSQTVVASGFDSPPTSVVVDASGDLFVTEAGNQVVEVMPNGQQTTLTSGDYYASALDAAGNLYTTEFSSNGSVHFLSADRKTTAEYFSGLKYPEGVAVDAAGDIYVADELGLHERVGSTGAILNFLFSAATGVAVDGKGELFVSSNGQENVTKIQLQSVNFGTANVCPAGQSSPAPCSQTLTLTYDVSAEGIFGTPLALTQGAPNLDFQVASNTCAGAHNAGDQCTVTVTFAPTAPGARNGAVELVDASGNVLATTPVYGQGQGPAIAFNGGQLTTLSTGATYPTGVAVDGAGNLYVADGVGNQVNKVTPGGTQTTVVSGLNDPNGLAVDGAGNLYIADYSNNRVLFVPPGGGATKTVGSGLRSPSGVAVDGQGNVYIADFGAGQVVEVVASSGVQRSVGSGFQHPEGVAVDGLGDVFVVDLTLNTLVEVPAGGGAQVTLSSDLLRAKGIALDGTGDIYVADTGHNRLIEFPAAGGPEITLTSAIPPNFLALDASGDVFVSDLEAQLVELPRSQPPAFSYSATNLSTTSSDSPMSVQVANIGNQPLDLAYTLSPAGGSYAQVAGSGPLADCSASSAFTLVAGAICNLSISFTPQTVGPNPGSVLFADNTLNANAATQTLALSGTGNAQADTISFTTPASGSTYTYGQQVQAVVSTQSSGTFTYTSAGAATVSPTGLISFGSTGSGSVTATQAASGSYATGTATTTVNVTAASTTTTLTATKASGNTAQLSANVAPAQPGTYPTGITGTVTFFDNGAQIGSPVAVINGSANLTTPAYSGTQTFTAIYNGSTLYLASPPSNSASLTFTVNPTITFPGLAASYSYGQSFTVAASSTNKTGAITYKLISGPATVTPAGMVTITGEGTVVIQAMQAASTGYNAYTQNASFAAVQAASQTKLTASLVKSGYGSAASLSVSVLPQFSGSPTGSVSFFDNGTTIATVPVTNGAASYTTAQLVGASHSFTATYTGDANFTGSNSNTVALTVPVTAVSLQLASTQLTYPLPPAFAIRVGTGSSPAPTGTVTVYDGGTAVAKFPLYALTNGYLLGLVLPPLNVGTHTLQAVYSGDGNHAPGQSAPVTVTVTPGPVQLSLNCASTRLKPGQTLSCTVSAYEGVLPVAGTVNYTVTAWGSGTVTLNKAGQAPITYVVPNSKGSYTLTATYAAQGNYQAAPPASVNFTVN